MFAVVHHAGGLEMAIVSNTYSPTWFALFVDAIEPAQTQREVEFLARLLPIAKFSSVLDVCCGKGRHALELAKRGYHVTGIDSNAAAIQEARASARDSAAQFLVHDMRAIDRLDGAFDAVLCLWQSFGHFDDETNRDVLMAMAQRLAPGGRLVLDIYNPAFFKTRHGTLQRQVAGRIVTEHKAMVGERLYVRLEYDNSAAADEFEWQLFTPMQLANLAQAAGLTLILKCTQFDEHKPPSANSPRMQLVFARHSRAGGNPEVAPQSPGLPHAGARE